MTAKSILAFVGLVALLLAVMAGEGAAMGQWSWEPAIKLAVIGAFSLLLLFIYSIKEGKK